MPQGGIYEELPREQKINANLSALADGGSVSWISAVIPTRNYPGFKRNAQITWFFFFLTRKRCRGFTIFVVLDEIPQCLKQHQLLIRSLGVQQQKETGALPGFSPLI